ncbi:hypothetical protein IFR05_000433 [Cadophora sp. M221]|nr:hypothetical protein IFR05_000433 [Cadophora sp. M221]
MTLNTTYDCASLTKYAGFFISDQLNITEVVTACPEHCKLAWGTGNPDLSGIGVFISYALQLVICIVLGPGHIVLYRCFNQSRHDYLESIQLVALNTTILFALPVAIASFTYLKTGPDLFEMAFIYYLNLMQFLAGISLFCSWVTCAVRANNEIDFRSIATVFVGGSLHTGLFGGLLSWIDKSSFKDQRFVEFVSICKTYGYLIPNLPPVLLRRPPIVPSNRRLNDFVLVCIIAGGVLLLMILFRLLVHYEKRIEALLVRTAPIGETNEFWSFKLAACMVSLGCTSTIAWSFAKMHVIREQLTQNTKGRVEDNEWGFGQVVAIFLWIPLLLESLGLLIVVITAMFGASSRTVLSVALSAALSAWARWRNGNLATREDPELPVTETLNRPVGLDGQEGDNEGAHGLRRRDTAREHST